MNNYERNNTMVACVIAFIIVGGAALGGLFLLGSLNISPWIPNNNNWDEGTLFEFERTGETIPDEIAVNVDIGVGAIYVRYVNDPALTYEISIWVPNNTLETEGNPTVAWSSNTITVEYQTCGINITLGVNATYSLNLETSTGAIAIELDNQAHVGSINATTSTGAIALDMTDDVVIEGDITFDLHTSTGAIALAVDLPTGVGGHFIGSTGTGSVDVTPVGWSVVIPNVYETSDYDTATDTVTITATTGTGSVAATLG
ncbi:MAG: hypothetical protein ACFFED_10060 [Candidatus Thorarchaeota archaeon]